MEPRVDREKTPEAAEQQPRPGEAIATVPAQLSGTLTMAASNGAATFSDLMINAPANGHTLMATAAGLTAASSAPFNLISP
ncbi:MAG: hypothetical protein GWN71_10965 [Gammaproteobacteria bacterium]|nr:hypothetical protein [Gammaproteobacteria bacterium]